MHESASQRDRADRYQIRLQGHLDARWTPWFDGLSLTNSSDGTTVLEGSVVDQAALHGLLHKLRDIGLPLVSVVRIDSDPVARRNADAASSSEGN